LHFQWIVDYRHLNGNTDENILQELEQKQKVLSSGNGNNGLVVRIILSSLGPVKDKQTLMRGMTIWIASKVTPLGLNHTSLQVGPYLIHWTDSHVVTLHDVGDHQNVFALLYPDKNFYLDIHEHKDSLLNLCTLMVEFNNTRYNNLTNNCQKFVDAALESISCNKTWIKNGPINRFLGHVTKTDCGVNNMSFWDENDQQHAFKNYDEFRLFCEQNSAIKALIEDRAYLESPGITDPKDREKAELLQILKAIERGFQIQLPNDQKEKSLIFPIQSFEKVGEITAFPAETLFVPIKEQNSKTLKN